MKDSLHFDGEGHLNDEGVALYVDALRLDRTERLPEPLRAHVAECQKCRMNVTGLYSLLAEEVMEDSHPTLGKTPTWRLVPMAYRVAAIVVAGIGIATLVYYVYMKPNGKTEQSLTPASVEAPARQDSTPTGQVKRADRAESREIAANYTPYEELEGLIGSEIRGEAFEAIRPGEHVAGRQDIHFSWKTTASGPWKVVVLNNRGTTIKEAEVLSTEFVLKGPIAPGLYYWKVIQNDELAHVGKFRVE